MTDHALPNDTFFITKQLPRIVLRDAQRLQQKRHIIEVKEKMRVARGSRRGSAPEIPWISEKIATLPLDRWVVESPEDGTWFFKVVLNGGLRANIQVDRDDDAFVSIHRDGASVGLATGGLKQVTTALMRLCYNR
ncbi:MAG: hypothetical protein WD492_03495 [Alkalispirochaeta sp.]